MKQFELFPLHPNDEAANILALNVRDAIDEEVINELVRVMSTPVVSVAPGQLKLDLK